MKQLMILMLTTFAVLCVFCIGCSLSERKVRIFDMNSGSVTEIRNAASNYTREIAESSPCQSGGTFATLQNRYSSCCDNGNDRSVIRVYDTNATLRCVSFAPYIYLSPHQFSVCSGKIIFWDSKADAEHKSTTWSQDLCIATLNNGNRIGNVKRIIMPLGCGATLSNDESFMWSSSTSVVVNVEFENAGGSSIAIVNTSSGDYRFLPLDIRTIGDALALSSFKGSLSRRYFSIVKPNGEIAVCDWQGNVCHIFNVKQLQAFGLYDTLSSERLTICWDDDDVLWIFNPKGMYMGLDVATNSVIRNGCVGLMPEEELMGLIKRRYAVVKRRRGSEIVSSILGHHFYVKDLESESCIVEMPNCISGFGYVYLGNGLMLLSDL